MGACGVTASGQVIIDRLKSQPQGEYDGAALALGVPCAILGIIGFLGCVWAIVAQFRRRS